MDDPAPASENTNATIVETGKVMSQNGTRPMAVLWFLLLMISINLLYYF
ncbi:hypothetical protein SD427_13390 [Chryseobacterium sp. JJR-5R]|nr:hypothetical protein [Chryseobacterium sp. JJR-5R]WPO81759.1 hypothetical protein SD427_13390 [Chryseobacterium sp. JJR-5R]